MDHGLLSGRVSLVVVVVVVSVFIVRDARGFRSGGGTRPGHNVLGRSIDVIGLTFIVETVVAKARLELVIIAKDFVVVQVFVDLGGSFGLDGGGGWGGGGGAVVQAQAVVVEFGEELFDLDDVLLSGQLQVLLAVALCEKGQALLVNLAQALAKQWLDLGLSIQDDGLVHLHLGIGLAQLVESGILQIQNFGPTFAHQVRGAALKLCLSLVDLETQTDIEQDIFNTREHFCPNRVLSKQRHSVQIPRPTAACCASHSHLLLGALVSLAGLERSSATGLVLLDHAALVQVDPVVQVALAQLVHPGRDVRVLHLSHLAGLEALGPEVATLGRVSHDLTVGIL